MKRKICFLIFISALLIVPLSYAQEDYTNLGDIITQLEQNPQFLEEINNNIDSIEIPGPISKIIGDEKVNLNLELDNEEVKKFFIEAQDGQLEGIDIGHNEEATIEFSVDGAAIHEIFNSEGDPKIIKNALNEGIDYRGLNLSTKVKLFFVKIIQKVAFLFV